MANLDKVGVKTLVIGGCAVSNSGVVRLVGLDENCGILVAAVGATDDLGEQLEGAFFAAEVGEGKAGIGLDDAEGSEIGKIKAFGDHLGADDDIWVLLGDESINAFGVVDGVVGIETDNFGSGKKFGEFGLEQFGAEAFVQDVSMMADWTAGGNGRLKAAGVALEIEMVGVKVEREETMGTESLPTAVVADGERGGTAAIMKNHGLSFGLEGVLDGVKEGIGKKTVFFEMGAVFEVDKSDGGGFTGLDSELIEGDDGVLLFGKVIIGDAGSGGAKKRQGS